jgi:hypothetical protein
MNITASFIADLVVPELEPVIGAPAVIAALVAVIVLEAVLLKLLRWDAAWLRCFLHSFAINMVTTLIGMLISLTGDQPLLHRNSESATIFAVFGIAWVASWLIEAFLLKGLKRDGTSPFTKSLIINTASYILLFVLATIGFN